MEDICVRIRIRHECDPFPTAVQQPRFLKEAWGGLEVAATKLLLPGEGPEKAEHLKNGAYMVTYSDFLAALSKHNRQAHEWYYASVRGLAESSVSVAVPVPFDCCEVI